MAARREPVLRRLASECEALVSPTDVTDSDAVKRLAEKSEEAFGGVDVWINNAGTGVFGPYQEARHRTQSPHRGGEPAWNYAWDFVVLPVFLRQNRGA